MQESVCFQGEAKAPTSLEPPRTLDRLSLPLRHAGGETKVLVNQKLKPKGDAPSHVMGTFEFAAGKEGRVEIANAGTDGHVIVDAVQWLPTKR